MSDSEFDVLGLLSEQQKKDVLYARQHFLGGELLSPEMTEQELEVVASYYRQEVADGCSRNIATIVIGPPGSGKSTLINAINNNGDSPVLVEAHRACHMCAIRHMILS